jgi:hypothetical protein
MHDDNVEVIGVIQIYKMSVSIYLIYIRSLDHHVLSLVMLRLKEM